MFSVNVRIVNEYNHIKSTIFANIGHENSTRSHTNLNSYQCTPFKMDPWTKLCSSSNLLTKSCVFEIISASNTSVDEFFNFHNISRLRPCVGCYVLKGIRFHTVLEVFQVLNSSGQHLSMMSFHFVVLFCAQFAPVPVGHKRNTLCSISWRI